MTSKREKQLLSDSNEGLSYNSAKSHRRAAYAKGLDLNVCMRR